MRSLFCVPVALALLACKGSEDRSGGTAGAASAQSTMPLRWVPAPSSGPVGPIVRDEIAREAAEKGRVIVYVGAAWCEPCQRFHQAAAHGELDHAFSGLTVLEFDLDRDSERLVSAGYESRYIPLFALPARDGTASGKQIEGAIKGDGAVAFIVPRLKDLLAQ